MLGFDRGKSKVNNNIIKRWECRYLQQLQTRCKHQSEERYDTISMSMVTWVLSLFGPENNFKSISLLRFLISTIIIPDLLDYTPTIFGGWITHQLYLEAFFSKLASLRE